MNSIEKYTRRVRSVNSLLCVGLDADISKIPERFQKQQYPRFAFNKWIIEETHAYVAAYKPNMAFYEAGVSSGLHELELTISYLRDHHPDIFTICDAKRGDIGNTNDGYVTSIFDQMGFDAVTVHPYLGKEALSPFLERKDKGIIILCKTSNPGAGEIQDQQVDGKPVWEVIAQKVSRDWNQNKNCMLVVGATYPKDLGKIREIVEDMTLLIPGIGAQGGEVESTVKAGLNSRKEGMIISSSRGIIFNSTPSLEARKLRDEINEYR